MAVILDCIRVGRDVVDLLLLLLRWLLLLNEVEAVGVLACSCLDSRARIDDDLSLLGLLRLLDLLYIHFEFVWGNSFWFWFGLNVLLIMTSFELQANHTVKRFCSFFFYLLILRNVAIVFMSE